MQIHFIRSISLLILISHHLTRINYPTRQTYNRFLHYTIHLLRHLSMQDDVGDAVVVQEVTDKTSRA